MTAKDAATGRTFWFQVKDQAHLAKLKAGHGVDADFSSMKGSLNLGGGATKGIVIVNNRPEGVR